MSDGPFESTSMTSMDEAMDPDDARPRSVDSNCQTVEAEHPKESTDQVEKRSAGEYNSISHEHKNDMDDVSSESSESESSSSESDTEEEMSEGQTEKEQNPTEHDSDSDQEKSDAIEALHNSNFTQLSQRGAMPPGESHVITAPSGRRFIAHIYEQGADGQQVPAPAQQADQGEGNMARTLCLNLLNELVKGSYQLIMFKKKRGSEDDDAGKEEESHDAKDNNGQGSSGQREESCQDVNDTAISKSDDANELDGSAQLSDADEQDSEPPFKKAKFEWQIKKSSCEQQDSVSSLESDEKEETEVVDEAVVGTSSSCKQDKPLCIEVDPCHQEEKRTLSRSGDCGDCTAKVDAGELCTSNECVSKSRPEQTDVNPNYSKAPDSNGSECSASCGGKAPISSPINVPQWKPSATSGELKIPLSQSTETPPDSTSKSFEQVQNTDGSQNVDRVKAQLVQKMVELQTRNCTSTSIGASRSAETANTAPLRLQSGDVLFAHRETGRNSETKTRVTETNCGSETTRPREQESDNSLELPGANATYLERWQSHHMAKAIVDNAINRTLEEMGLSPDTVQNAQRNQRRQVEDVGVAQVIRQRGLQGGNRQTTMPTLQPQPHAPASAVGSANQNPTHAQRLNPIISRLTQVSENIFVQNVQHGLRLSARIDLGALNQQVQQTRQQVGGGDQNQTDSQQNVDTSLPNDHAAERQSLPQPNSNNASVTLTVSRNSESSQDDSSKVPNEETEQNDISLGSDDSEFDKGADLSSSNSQTSNTIDPGCAKNGDVVNTCSEERNCIATSSSGSEIGGNISGGRSIVREQDLPPLSSMPGPDDIEGLQQKALSDIEKIEAEAPSTSFILDHALNAAITEKGLHFQ